MTIHGGDRGGGLEYERRLATELRDVDYGDLAERTIRRVREDRAYVATAMRYRPESLLTDLPPPETAELFTHTLATLRALPRTHRPRPRPTQHWLRWPAMASLAAASVLAVLWLGPDLDSLPPSSDELVVRRINGRVDVRSLQGSKRAAVGDRLEAGDVLVTVGDAEAVVAVGSDASVVLDPFSKVRVAEQTGRRRRSSVPELEVLLGRAEGRLARRRASPSLRFSVAGKSYGLVSGRLGVVRVGADRYLLAAVSDAVVETDDGEVVLPEANVLRVSPKSTPRPEPWPRTVALSLKQHKPIGHGKAKAVVVGQTNPDVILIINKIRVPVDENGRFVATLNVPAKTELLEAEVRDPLGRVQRKRVPVIRAKSRVDWLEPG